MRRSTRRPRRAVWHRSQWLGMLVGAFVSVFASAATADTTDTDNRWHAYLGQWQTASKPAYQDMFHVQLRVVSLQTGYELTWQQNFAAYPARELRRARLSAETATRWRYRSSAATGRTRDGAAWFDDGVLRFEYREHDPSGQSARILETFVRIGPGRMESSRKIWRAGGWQPLTAESWWRVGDN